MKKIIFTVLIVLNILFYSSSSTFVLAIDSTPSSKLVSSQSGLVKGTTVASESSSLASKLKDLEKQIASKAAQLKLTMTKKLQNKAYFGIITSITDSKITIESAKDIKQISVNEYTDFNLPAVKGKKISNPSTKDLTQGDFISALGDIDDKNVLTAKKLIKSNPIATDSAKFIWGQIEGISNGSMALKTSENKRTFIFTNAKTTFSLGKEEASIADAKISKFIVAKGKTDKDGNINATFIYFIPSAGFIKPEKKTASPSATPSSSSAKTSSSLKK